MAFCEFEFLFDISWGTKKTKHCSEWNYTYHNIQHYYWYTCQKYHVLKWRPQKIVPTQLTFYSDALKKSHPATSTCEKKWGRWCRHVAVGDMHLTSRCIYRNVWRHRVVDIAMSEDSGGVAWHRWRQHMPTCMFWAFMLFDVHRTWPVCDYCSPTPQLVNK